MVFCFFCFFCFFLEPTEKPLSKYYKDFPTKTSYWNQCLSHKEIHIYHADFSFKWSRLWSRSTTLLLKLNVEIKAFITSYLDETLYLKEVNLSYKDFLLKSKPLSWEGHVDYVDFSFSSIVIKTNIFLFRPSPFILKK